MESVWSDTNNTLHVTPPQWRDPVLTHFLSSSFTERRSSDSEAGKSYVNDLVTTLQTVKTGRPGTERRQAMTSIIRIVRSGNINSILENFRTLLRVLLENLEDSEGSSRALVFGVLTEMLKQDSLIGGFHAFTELIILKVLQAHKDPEKDVSILRAVGSCLQKKRGKTWLFVISNEYFYDASPYITSCGLQVVRAAEACAATMSGLLPPEMVVRVLNPIIKTGDFPVNQVDFDMSVSSPLSFLSQAAIKMLSKLVEKQTADTMEPHVGDVMPGLLKVSCLLSGEMLSSSRPCRRTTMWRAVWGKPPSSASCHSTSWWGRPRSSLTSSVSMDQKWSCCLSTSRELRPRVMQVQSDWNLLKGMSRLKSTFQGVRGRHPPDPSPLSQQRRNSDLTAAFAMWSDFPLVVKYEIWSKYLLYFNIIHLIPLLFSTPERV